VSSLRHVPRQNDKTRTRRFRDSGRCLRSTKDRVSGCAAEQVPPLPGEVRHGERRVTLHRLRRTSEQKAFCAKVTDTPCWRMSAARSKTVRRLYARQRSHKARDVYIAPDGTVASRSADQVATAANSLAETRGSEKTTYKPAGVSASL